MKEYIKEFFIVLFGALLIGFIFFKMWKYSNYALFEDIKSLQVSEALDQQEINKLQDLKIHCSELTNIVGEQLQYEKSITK